jgi:hypothetical protein
MLRNNLSPRTAFDDKHAYEKRKKELLTNVAQPSSRLGEAPQTFREIQI